MGVGGEEGGGWWACLGGRGRVRRRSLGVGALVARRGLLAVLLEGQQVGLLLLQALVETLGLPLLLQLPPFELLMQSVPVCVCVCVCVCSGILVTITL